MVDFSQAFSLANGKLAERERGVELPEPKRALRQLRFDSIRLVL